MFPPVTVLQPDMGRRLLEYRWARLEQALEYATGTGWSGARYPWESAFTGGKVCPDWAAETRDHQHHITGDISFAVRQYLSVTGDVSILTNFINGHSGCQFVYSMAEFWASRATYNSETERYDILGVMGPDEYHGTTDNNVYTNVVASLAIYFSHFTECVANCSMIPELWLEVARSITIPYNQQEDYHPQYSGYQPGTIIKQADTILVGYPLMFPMNASTRTNDLEMYEGVTDLGGPAMTWGMHAIGDLELGEVEEAEPMFQRSYQPYVQPPFYIWTESKNGEGAVNFITGMGGFLQAMIFGYLGLRTHMWGMKLEPRLPPNSTSLSVTGINLQKAEFNMLVQEIEGDVVIWLEVTNAGDGLSVTSGTSEEVILEVEINKPGTWFLSDITVIEPLNVDFLDKCSLPIDIIDP